MAQTRSLGAGVRAALVAAALLVGCGGGDHDTLPHLPGLTCSTIDERLWLADYFDEWYFWYRLAPDPNPLRERTLAEFFEDSLYTGGDPRFPRDRWSHMEDTADFDRYFVDGRRLGYGVYLAGIEIAGQPGRPLRVRFVDAGSDADRRGVRRGDEVVSVNGRAAAQIVAADDYGVFTPEREGQTLLLALRRDGIERTVSLRATTYELTPVSHAAVVPTPTGRRMGYLLVRDLITPAEDPLAAAFAGFAAAGVDELVIDLRYNGGGLVSVATVLASYVAGARADGRTFASLLFNDRRARRNNEVWRFGRPSAALPLQRVYLLTGPRTCSAAEMVINGLRPHVDVVTVGDTTCGKPVGFLPVSRCGTTFNVVNFEAVNALDEGRYFDGIDATCAVAENLSQPLGSADEALLAAARRHADGGGCAAAAGPRRQPLAAGGPLGRGGEPRERQGMWRR